MCVCVCVFVAHALHVVHLELPQERKAAQLQKLREANRVVQEKQALAMQTAGSLS